MIKKNSRLLIITSIVILLPILLGIALWNQLPEEMPIHWNAQGEVDGTAGKAFSVFGLPLILLAFQWVCVLATSADPKQKNHPKKVLALVFWIIPLISIVMELIVYATALGKEINVNVVLPMIMGIMFVFIGNYLPKCKQNYTIGIKIPWTLNNEENWNKTHRLAGILWVICGILIILTGFLGNALILFPVLLVMVIVPIIYSYILYRKGK